MNANTFFNNKAGLAKPPYRFNQFGGNLGGPLVRDRLFYFYNYNGQRNTSPNTVFFPVAPPADPQSPAAVRELSAHLEPYETGLRNDIHTAKLDWVANQTHILTGRYNVTGFWAGTSSFRGRSPRRVTRATRGCIPIASRSRTRGSYAPAGLSISVSRC